MESKRADGQRDPDDSDDEGRSFGELLRRYRLAAGLTQPALAERAHLSVQAIGALERGARRSPHRVTSDLLADALSLSPRQREAFAAAARSGRIPPGPSDSGSERRHRLPVPPTPLVGREREVAQARDLLRRSQVRLLTLTGCPGVGKTRLGLAVAAELAGEFSEEVFFVPLASLRDPGWAGSAIGQALGVRPVEGADPVDALIRQIGSRRLLLLLDNFEHLLPAARLVSELLAACPALHLLVTSRATLRLRGEHQLPIRPLPIPDRNDVAPDVLRGVASVTLFLQRAEASSPGFELTPSNARAVAELCRRLDGLPLALELAAARIRLLPPGLLLKRLEHCMEVLVDGPEDVPEHQRTMRSTLEWSFGLLSPGEQALLRRLSVFCGGASAEAIETVCQAAGPLPKNVLASVAGLLEKSLVECEAGESDLRVSMLEVVRAYGLELLAQAAETDVTCDAHAAYYLELAKAAEPALKRRGQLDWLDLLEREHDNFRAALRWARESGRIEQGLALAGRLWRLWERRGYVREGLALLDDLLERPGEVAPETRARALNAAGNLYRWVDWRARAARYEASLALYRELGDRDGIGRVLGNLGMVANDRGDHRGAIALYEESVEILRSLGDDHSVANGLANIGGSAMEVEDLQRAASALQEANCIRRRLGDSLGLARSLMSQGVVMARLGDREGCGALMEESLRLCNDLRDEATRAYELARRGDAARALGQGEQAGADYAEALAVSLRVGAARVAGMCVEGLAALAAADGAEAVAARLRGAAASVREACGMPAAPVNDGSGEAWSEGRSLSLEEAANEALAWWRGRARE
jgi:predicted ATPase/DNA-binding XRE family transcriptional regulator